MAQSTLETVAVSSPLMGAHLEPRDIAAYIDRVVDAAERGRIEAHLASCEACRSELADAARLVATLPRRRVPGQWLAAVAAAAVILVVAWPRDVGDRAAVHREAPVAATILPRGLAPTGQVDIPLRLTWSSVPNANNYRVRIFDEQGSVVFQRETADTVAGVPDAIRLRAGRRYFWNVEARAGFDRTVASELIEFSLRSGALR